MTCLTQPCASTIPFDGYMFYKFVKQDLTIGPDIMGEVTTPCTHSNSAMVKDRDEMCKYDKAGEALLAHCITDQKVIVAKRDYAVHKTLYEIAKVDFEA